MIIGTCVTIGAVPVQAFTCQDTGENCVVGGLGPKGGIIFYDAGSQQWWGRYLEAQPGSVERPEFPGMQMGFANQFMVQEKSQNDFKDNQWRSVWAGKIPKGCA